MFRWQFYNRAVEKQFRKLDPPVQRRIMAWLDAHIEGSTDPRAWGRALEGPLGTMWRYRVGDYRVIAKIEDGQFLVLVVKTGNRSDVYSVSRGGI